ncbi:MAG: 8-amino-7-oxononanoate synthase [Syntrophorhabdaceae bacterium]|nr:8-amino-7-oxononanoate synthase [Syntrophorhabdaceae bacterium]
MRERLTERLEEIKERGNYRTIKYVKPLSATRLIYESREYLNLCSNSYLSLHFHPQIIEEALKAINEYGVGVCSSRSVSGSVDLYKILEEEVAGYKGYERGLIFSNGYLANIGIISTLTDEDDVIFTDELNHSSLIHSMRLSRAKKVIYRHRDLRDLEKKLAVEACKGKRFVVTESIFSMDGDIAPLDGILELKKKYEFYTIVDDAHGTGVFGDKGSGVEEMFGLSGMMDVHMGTFGKSLGSYGAFVLADGVIIDFLINRAKTFMYTTSIPASSLASSLAALRIIKNDLSFKDKLWANIKRMREGLKGAGLDLKESYGPIIPIVVGEDSKAVKMQELLMEKGLFLQAIRPPTVPEGTSRLRLTVVSGFTEEEIDYAVHSIIDIGKRLGII